MDIEVEHRQGIVHRNHGEFTNHEYVDYLLIRSKALKTHWKRQVTDGKASGSIKSKRKIVFNFRYDEHSCAVQKVSSDQSVGEWEEIECMMVRCD